MSIGVCLHLFPTAAGEAALAFKLIHNGLSSCAAWTRVTGWRAADAVGKSASILQGPDTQEESLEMIRAALNVHYPVAIKVKLINYTFQVTAHAHA